MAKKVKIGFIGCGGISEAHLQGLSTHPDVSLVAFCDVNEVRTKVVQEKYSKEAELFTDAETMFKNVELDGVYCCLPPFAHGAELLAVKYGVPFAVEKPVNLYEDQAREIAQAVDEKGLMTAALYMNRYRKGIQTVRDLLKKDPAIFLLGGWIGGSPRGAADTGIISWWIQKDKSGGQFHEQVTHTVDVACFLCGDVIEVHAYGAKGFNKGVPTAYSIEDAAVVNLKFSSGAVANLWASASSNGGGSGVTLNVYANDFTALFNGWEHSVKILRTGQNPEEIPGEGNIFAIEDDAFVQAIKSKDPSKLMATYRDGFKTMQVTLAANRSMEIGAPVSIQ
ncbi:MAG: Gfo/Idh/MocA family oxidoreductase [Candidatus Poribacteria bacterium]